MEQVSFAVAVGTAGAIPITINILVVIGIIILLALSKRLRGVVEDSPVLFAIITMFLFGFVGWLISWAFFEIISAMVETKSKDDGLPGTDKEPKEAETPKKTKKYI